MVAYLEKLTENDGFAQIVDFLNVHPIRYALTINPTIYVSCIKQFWSTAKTKTINRETQIHAKVDSKTIIITQSSIRSDLQLADDDDEAVTKEWEDIMERAATTASSLKVEQDSGNIHRTQSMVTLNEPSPQGTGSGSGPRVNTLRSGEDRLKLKELMELCTKLFDRVLALEKTKTAQAKEICWFEEQSQAVGKKEKGKQSSIFRESNSDQVDINDTIDEAYNSNMEDTTTGTEVNTASAPVTTAGVFVSTAELVTTASEVVTTVEPSTPLTTTAVIVDEDLTITQTLMKLRSEKSKERGVVIKEPSETATRSTVPPQLQIPAKDKGKCIMQEPEKPVKVKGKDQICSKTSNRVRCGS
ncbi:hypothetical protein Tco_0424723 [Tanacetum coccineum]